MPASPLILGQTQRQMLATLRQHAIDHPVDVLAIRRETRTRDGRAAHLHRMQAFSVEIPSAFFVTFSVELGHRIGACRHLSVSSTRHRRTPTPAAVWLLAEALGFVGDLKSCVVWQEDIGDGDVAINVVQPVGLDAATMQVVH